MPGDRFASVWDAIEDTHQDAENMRLRSQLMMAITRHIESNSLRQADAAKIFGVTQPRVSDLVRGKIALFSLDTLVNMLSAAGIHIKFSVEQAHREMA